MQEPTGKKTCLVHDMESAGKSDSRGVRAKTLMRGRDRRQPGAFRDDHLIGIRPSHRQRPRAPRIGHILRHTLQAENRTMNLRGTC
jgi:hypothetical protein